MPDAVEANGEDATSSEEEKEDKETDVNGMCRAEDCITQGNFHNELANSDFFVGHVNGSTYYHSDDEDDRDVGDNSVPTIFFSHTVEPKRVCTLLNFYLLLKRLHKIYMLYLNHRCSRMLAGDDIWVFFKLLKTHSLDPAVINIVLRK